MKEMASLNTYLHLTLLLFLFSFSEIFFSFNSPHISSFGMLVLIFVLISDDISNHTINNRFLAFVLFLSSVWDSMMDGHVDAKNVQTTTQQQQQEEQQYDDRQQYLQREQFKQQNPLFKDDTTGNEETSFVGSAGQYEDDEHNNYLHAATNQHYAYVSKPHDLDNHEHLEQNTNYLMGSMVSYMMPDGSPVKEKMFQTLPPDDDREDMTMGSRKMPTMRELYDSIKTMDEKPKIIMELPPPPPTTAASAATTVDNIAESSRTIRTLYGNYRIH